MGAKPACPAPNSPRAAGSQPRPLLRVGRILLNRSVRVTDRLAARSRRSSHASPRGDPAREGICPARGVDTQPTRCLQPGTAPDREEGAADKSTSTAPSEALVLLQLGLHLRVVDLNALQ